MGHLMHLHIGTASPVTPQGDDDRFCIIYGAGPWQVFYPRCRRALAYSGAVMHGAGWGCFQVLHQVLCHHTNLSMSCRFGATVHSLLAPPASRQIAEKKAVMSDLCFD